MPESAGRLCVVCQAGVLDSICTGCGAPADCWCPSCGANVRPIDRFCHSCGMALQQPTSPCPMVADGDPEEGPHFDTPSPEPQTTIPVLARPLSPDLPVQWPRSSPTAAHRRLAPPPEIFTNLYRPRQPDFEPEPEPLPAGPPPQPVPAIHAVGSPRCSLASAMAMPSQITPNPQHLPGRVSPPAMGPSPSSSSQGISPSSMPPGGVLSARSVDGTTSSKVSGRRGSGVPLTDEQRYFNLLADLEEGQVALADFSYMRPRGQRVLYFQLPQILAATNQSPTCHTLKLSYNDLSSSDVRNYLLPFFAQTRIQKVWIDGNPGILADVAREILEVNRARQLPLWIETNETGLPPAVRIQLKQIDNTEYLARRQMQEINAVDTDKKWGNQQRFHQGRTVKPYVSQAQARKN
eukprot:GGOE01021885.1.p1 GENE.GGOE01021885.1~~GGOE01021885.1.p1  ORF type:complete len:407 (-),score=46.56 GGOE01021885.1:313-1533(-)